MATIEGLLQALVALLTAHLRSSSTPAPPLDEEPLPPAAGGRRVARVGLQLSRVQLSHTLHPEAYTEENPMGLIPPGPIERGEQALPWGSNFWLDLTARDENGEPFVETDVERYGLSYRTTHRAGEAQVVGLGALPDGSPAPGYKMDGSWEIGAISSRSWISTRGFMMRFKALEPARGGTFACGGSVAGVAANGFSIRVE